MDQWANDIRHLVLSKQQTLGGSNKEQGKMAPECEGRLISMKQQLFFD